MIETAERKAAKKRLWQAGELSWKFQARRTQRLAYDFIRQNWGRSPFLMVCAHRRWGKSTAAIIIGLEECIRHPNTRVAVVCETKDQARAICEESFVEILADCPAEVRPRRLKNEFIYVCDWNGSSIVILAAGALNAKKGRGRKFALVIIDEAAFIDNLKHMVKSVFGPTLRDTTGKTFGTLLITSTPPELADHDFESMFEAARADGRAFFLPLSQNPDASPEFIAAAIADCEGAATADYQREYECKFPIDNQIVAAIPEFHARAHAPSPKGMPPIVREVPKPDGSDLYASMHPGGAGLTALLFGYYHHDDNLIVIQDELALENSVSDDLALQLKAKETQLWGAEHKDRLVRVSDVRQNDQVRMRILWDLGRLHKLRFSATARDGHDAQINEMRLSIREGIPYQIAIDPRCTRLIQTIRGAVRAKKDAFAPLAQLGNADLLVALLELLRNVTRRPKIEPPKMRQVERDLRPPPKAFPNAATELSKAIFGQRLRR